MFLKNQRGSVLVLVLVVMLSLTVLGTALLSSSIIDKKQAVRQDKNNEAFYFARSGAEAVAHYLQQNPDKISDVLIQGEDEVTIGNGKFVISVTEEDGKIKVESRGHSGDFSEKVSLSLIPGAFPELDMAVFCEGGLSLGTQARIYGDVGTNSVANNSVTLGTQSHLYGDVYVGPGGDPDEVINTGGGWFGGAISGNKGNLPEERHYPMPVFPEFPDLPYKGSLIANNFSGTTISENGYYDSINVRNQCSLTFNVGSGTLRVRAKDFVVGSQGSVTVRGSGKLILFVEDNFEMCSQTSFNWNSDPNKVMLYYKGELLKFSAQSSFYGCIYVERAKIDLSTQGDIIGSIFSSGTEVKLSTQSATYVRAIYAPNATVTLATQGEVRGPIVCSEFAMATQGRVYFRKDGEEVWDWNVIPDIEFDSGDVGFKIGDWSN